MQVLYSPQETAWMQMSTSRNLGIGTYFKQLGSGRHLTVKIGLGFADTINQIVITCMILWDTSADSAQLCPNQSKCNFKAIPARVTITCKGDQTSEHNEECGRGVDEDDPTQHLAQHMFGLHNYLTKITSDRASGRRQ